MTISFHLVVEILTFILPLWVKHLIGKVMIDG